MSLCRCPVILAAVLLTLALPGTVAAGEITLTLDFQQPVIRTVDGHALVEFPDAWAYGDPGEPMVPLRNVQLMLPPGEEIVEVTAVPSDPVALDGTFTLKVGQMQYPLSLEGPVTPDLPKAEIYDSFTPYPSNPVGAISTQFLYGHGIGAFTVCPIRYVPASGEVSYYPQVEIHVVTSATTRAEESLSLLRTTPSAEARLARLVENPSAASAYRGVAVFPETKATTQIVNPSDDYDYAIITTSAYEAQMEQLAQYKSQRGLRTVIVLTTDIYAQYTGADNQTKIRNFIIDAYSGWGIDYVLLAGDDELIPHRGLYAVAYGSYTDTDIAADMYYGALDGNWNTDGDSYWGEPNEADLIPEVHVGRAPIDNATKTANFLNKTLMYQETPVLADCRKALMLGELLWDDPTYGCDYKDEIKFGASTWGYTTVGFNGSAFHVSTLYDRDLGTWSKFAAIDSLNHGINIANHLGHANVTYTLRMYNSDVDNYFTNNGVNHGFFVLYTQGCYCGSFDNRDESGYYGVDAICEHFTTEPEAAVVFIGNSRYGYGEHSSTNGSSQYFDRQFFDALFAENLYTVGQCNDDSKVDNIGYMSYGANRWCCYELNIMGDPSLQMWTDVPSELTATFPEYLPTVYSEFPVTVSAAGGPVAGAQVCLWKDGDIFLVDTTDANGEVMFEPEPATAGFMTVTVTKHDWLPFQGTAEVLPGTPPGKPTGLAAAPGDAQVSLSWNANPETDLSHYVIYRDRDPNPIDSVGVTLAPGVEFVDVSAINDSTYYYRLRAVDTEGDKSPFTDNVMARPQAPLVIFLTHTPLSDTDDSAHPYPVTAEITTNEAPLLPDSILVVYEAFRGWQSVQMWNTGVPNEYRGDIPTMTCGTATHYYILAVDEHHNRETHPDLAPAACHSFNVLFTPVVSDPFETSSGWTVGATGDNATTGIWERCDPNATYYGLEQVQPENDFTPAPGVYCFVTGNSAVGAAQELNDVDGGKTTLLSPVIDLSSFGGATVSYRRWYTNDTGLNPSTDLWRVDVSDNNGSTWHSLENTNVSARAWTFEQFDLSEVAGLTLTAQMKFRFIAEDAGGGSVVEAGVDAFEVRGCPQPGDTQAPSVTLLQPNGGQELQGALPYEIRWSATDNVGVTAVNLYLSTDGGVTFPQTIALGEVNDGVYLWTVPDTDASQCRVRIDARDASSNWDSDMSDADLTIVRHDSELPTVAMVRPDGGEIVGRGLPYNIHWSAQDNVDVVWTQILFSVNSGAVYAETLAAGPYDSTFLWTAPDKNYDHCRIKIRVRDAAMNWAWDTSSADFQIGEATNVADGTRQVPAEVELLQNSPNPFNPATEIRFGLPTEADVTLEAFNVEGRLVRVLAQGRYPSGYHTVPWDGRDEAGVQVSSGVYFYRLVTDGGTITRKATMLK